MSLSLASFGLGFAAGFGTGLVTRELSHASASVIKPLVKSAVKTTLLAVDQLQTTLAFARESLEDIVAEAREELKVEAAQPVQGAEKTKKSKRKAVKVEPTVELAAEPVMAH